LLWYGIEHPWKQDAKSALAMSLILIGVALVLLGVRVVQRRDPLRLMAFPKRNYVETLQAARVNYGKDGLTPPM
jgi:hypothetical protein